MSSDAVTKERQARMRKLMRVLHDEFPNANESPLHYKSPWELLVAVILSAQCTDERVNEVTKKLFKKYPHLSDYTKAGQQEFEQDIRSTGFYRNKAKNILATAKKIEQDFGGNVPRTMEELLTLPGVARKTANVVLANAFGITSGIAVDTHVRRFALKFDLVDSKQPDAIERALCDMIPKEDWIHASYAIKAYGREICPARPHQCDDHPCTKIYPKAASVWPASK